MILQDHLSLLREYGYEPLEGSVRQLNGRIYTIALYEKTRFFIIIGQDDPLFCGEKLGGCCPEIKVCGLSHENRVALQTRFHYTVPTSLKGKKTTIGLGDRLGICTIAHISALRGTDVFPVLGQQSARELSLTGRSMESMIDDVVWQVFCAGYEGGFAIDGDHLKTLDEVEASVCAGATMITLDCSNVIDLNARALMPEEAETRCRSAFPPELLELWKNRYWGKRFKISDQYEVRFKADSFWQLLLAYGNVVLFSKEVYDQGISPAAHEVSFELSLDETDTVTDPSAHYFVASELRHSSVEISSIAPRFCGEFQKGIDYIGDPDRFEEEFRVHAAIASFFGHRISIHSGSDKFRVFPIIGRHTGGRFHLKTSGTSWVEAVRVIARYDPTLFRRMMAFADQHFKEALVYYHVSADPDNIPDIEVIPDEDLPLLLDEKNIRQIIHITYGSLLQTKSDDGERFLFRDDIYRVLQTDQAGLDRAICEHIRKHLRSLEGRSPHKNASCLV